MKNLFLVIQIIVSVLLAASILLQSRGTGLGTTFGDSSEQYRSKRGIENLLFRSTVVLLAVFLITSIVNLLIK